MIWDNSPAHRGDALRTYLTTPDLHLRLVNLPGYSPDLNGDEPIWGWVRQEATANVCLGTRAAVRERVGSFFADLPYRREEVKRRCRTVLQARVTEPTSPVQARPYYPTNVDFTLASVQVESRCLPWGIPHTTDAKLKASNSVLAVEQMLACIVAAEMRIRVSETPSNCSFHRRRWGVPQGAVAREFGALECHSKNGRPVSRGGRVRRGSATVSLCQ